MFNFKTPDVLSTALFMAVVCWVVFAVLFSVYRSYRYRAKHAALITVAVAAGLAVWLFFIYGIVRSGVLQEQPMPRLVWFFAGVNLVSLVFAIGPVGAALAKNLSFSALVGFHFFRFPLELILHRWALDGVIPMTMTWTGRNFDVATGLLSVLMLALMKTRPNEARRLALVFNVIGILLLLNVGRVAMLSSPLPFAWPLETPLQLVMHVPYFLIAPVCVGGALVAHVVLFRKLIDTRTSHPR